MVVLYIVAAAAASLLADVDDNVADCGFIGNGGGCNQWCRCVGGEIGSGWDSDAAGGFAGATSG